MSTPTPAAAQPLSLLDSLFLYGETASSKMHVAALLRFNPPPEAADEYLTDMVADIRRDAAVHEPWNRKLKYPKSVPAPLQSWIVDPNFDLDYHFRHSALPRPGGERELGTLISRLHSNGLDLTRPPWELHVIEGLDSGGVAIYIKMHHSLVDGYTGMRLLQRSLTTDPDDATTPILFAVTPPPRQPRPPKEPRDLLSAVLDSISGPVRAAQTGAAIAGQVGIAVGRQLLSQDIPDRPIMPLHAPESILNRALGRNRRFATQDLDLTAVLTIAKARRVTVNDLVLAVLGGALRRFLGEIGELPIRPLIAFVPVNIRAAGDAGGGNAVGAMLASTGTDISDPLRRLDAVATSTRGGKAQLKGMSQAAMLAYSAALLAPAIAQGSLVANGLPTPLPQTFNLVVSNVPGPKDARYFRGARLEGMYPASFPFHAAALNVTFMSYADRLNFGFIGDRDALPHLQHLAVYTADGFSELADAHERGR